MALNIVDEEDNDDWAVSTAPEFVSQRRLALLGGSDRYG